MRTRTLVAGLAATAVLLPGTAALASHPEARCGRQQPEGAHHTPIPSGSPSPSHSATPTTTTSEEQASAVFSLDSSTITVGRGTRLTTVALEEGTRVRVEAYTRPSTTYEVVRDHVVAHDGPYETTLRPPRNTRLRVVLDGVRQSGAPCQVTTSSVVLTVKNALSLSAYRNGTRDYAFQGRLMPAREDAGPVITLYRLDGGRRVITAQTRARADGTWRIDRRFLASGRWDFVAHVGSDMDNAAALSNWGVPRPTVIH